MQINLNPTSERGASRDAVNRPRETLGDSHLISSDPRSHFGLVCDLLCCRGNINEKIDAYLAAKVSIIWIIDPYRRTITVHHPDSVPKLFNVRDELSAEPHLPGFRVPVARLFE